MALKIDELLHPVTKHVMQVQTARSMRLGDFKTEDSFVLFGSPRSEPLGGSFSGSTGLHV